MQSTSELIDLDDAIRLDRERNLANHQKHLNPRLASLLSLIKADAPLIRAKGCRYWDSDGLDALAFRPASRRIRTSPADGAGLRAAFASQAAAANSDTLSPGGDVIIAADGRQMTGIEELATYLDENKQPGDTVELTILRDGEQIDVQVRLAEWPS